MIEARVLSIRDGKRLVLGRYTDINLILDVQFCKQLDNWVFSSIPPGYWKVGRRLSKLEFLLETGRDLNTSTEEFVKRNIDL